MVAGYSSDPPMPTAVRAKASLCSDVGTQTIARGIETKCRLQAEALRKSFFRWENKPNTDIREPLGGSHPHKGSRHCTNHHKSDEQITAPSQDLCFGVCFQYFPGRCGGCETYFFDTGSDNFSLRFQVLARVPTLVLAFKHVSRPPWQSNTAGRR